MSLALCEREETILMNKSKEKMKLLCHNGIAQIFSTMKIGLRKLKEMKELFPERRNLHFLWLVVLNGILSQMM